MVLIDFKGYLQGQKGPIWTFVIYVGQYLGNGACCDQCLYEAHMAKNMKLLFIYISMLLYFIRILTNSSYRLSFYRS